jgi:hypothetical protein
MRLGLRQYSAAVSSKSPSSVAASLVTLAQVICEMRPCCKLSVM